MKLFMFLIFLFITNIFACEGDCIKCHPILVKNGNLDQNHLILNKCKNCHNLTTNDMKKMNAGCGEDCWNCHSVTEVKKINIQEHKILDKCIKCHKKLNKKVNMNFNPINTTKFNSKSLYNVLLER